MQKYAIGVTAGVMDEASPLTVSDEVQADPGSYPIYQ